jgi:tetratricopeptide (TPR) repeat protein
MEASKPQSDALPPRGYSRLAAGLRERLGAASARVSRRTRIAGLVGVLMVAANLALVIAWLKVKSPSPSPAKTDYLAAALAALDRGDYADAKRLALLINEQGGPESTESGGPSFVQGAVTAREADSMWEEDQRRYYLLAARHLEEARRQGFPAKREPEGLFLLGKSLCLSREYSASRPILEAAMKADPTRTNEIDWLLARAYLWGAHPDLKLAMDHNERYLANPQLAARERFEGLLNKGQILFQDGRIEECLKVLAEIPSTAPSFADAIVIRGQLLMRAADKLKGDAGSTPTAESRRAVQQKYSEAIDTLRQAQNRGSSAERVVPQSMYLIGKCFLAMNDTRAALDQFRRTHQGFPDSIEGIAAAFQEADLLRRTDQDDEAIAAYRRAVSAVGDPAEYRNPLLTLDDIRRQLSDVYQGYSKAGRFEKAIKLADVLFPVFSREQQLEFAAKANQSWAATLLEQAQQSSTSDGRVAAREARAELRKAGEEFNRLAELRLASRAYPEDVWSSAECYFAGHDFRGAVRMLEEYLRYELRKRRPRALLNIGEAQLALEKFDRSLDALNECITAYPADAAGYRARLLAAKAHVEKGETKEAEALLRDNLENGYLTPSSPEWRDSLFAMGLLLQAEGRDEEAIPRMEEFVERYPDSPQLIDARYLIAEAYRRSARAPREKLESDTIETSRIAHNKQLQQFLTSAITQYEQVQDILTRRQEQTELEPSDQAILRNCYFARGAALYDMGHYDEAIRAYSAATNRYQHRPEVLEALMQIAACYRRLGKPDEARGTLEQAKVMLTRINREAPFAETTNYTREQWLDVLNWYASL